MTVAPSAAGTAAVRSGWVRVADAELHYRDAGSGPPLVLLHGWPQHSDAWRAVTPYLARSYRVVALDLRGLGRSRTSGSDFSLARLRDDVLALLDELGLDRVFLAGHDWGSAVGYRLCLAHPDRVERYVALGGVTPWVTEGSHPSIYARSWHIYALAAPLAGPALCERIASAALRSWRGRGSFTAAETEAYLAPLRGPMARRATCLYYRNVLRRELPYYARAGARLDLKTPTLHLNGADDPLTRGLGDSWRRHAAEMRLEELPGCGHFLAEEDPEQIAARIADFCA